MRKRNPRKADEDPPMLFQNRIGEEIGDRDPLIGLDFFCRHRMPPVTWTSA